MKKILSTIAVLISFAALTSVSASAQYVKLAPDDGLDACAWGKVVGLKSTGDGFLSVRTGPGTRYGRIDKIHNGQGVFMCGQQGDWIAVIYTKKGTDCRIESFRGRTYGGRCWNGWAHQNWIQLIAG